MKKLLAICFCLGLCSSANADFIFVNSRSDMSNDGLIDWGDLGSSRTTVPSPSTLSVSGIPGLDATVSQSENDVFQRLDQGNGWAGNFAPGATLLYTAGNNGPVDIVFSNPVSGGGSQFQSERYGNFTAKISAFDADNNLLASFNFNGVSNDNADNSAVFAGIVSSSNDISKIRFEGISALQDPNDFGIGNVTVQKAPPVSAVPEPMTLITFSGLFVGLAGMVRMQRQTKPAQA